MANVRWTLKWRRFRALDGADQFLLLRAAGWLAVARLQLLVFPFRKLSAGASLENGDRLESPDPDILRRTGYAVQTAANNVPWRADCFPQAIAASKLLQRQGYRSTIHLGVERGAADSLLGHAWVTCNGTVVSGGVELDRYIEIHSFDS